jgi:beta-aspartyl-dipeptidase (metallo-type)
VIVLRGAEVLAPEPLGRRDVVIAGETIVALAEPGVEIAGIVLDEHDLEGLTLAPGFIDNHVHVLGGGGGLGFASRAPELQTSQLVRAGITSVIGMLGFDATTKDMRALVAKTKAFKEDGISAYALTGATLEHPVPTLTGRIRDDIAFVEEIIGVGEISVSELGYAYDSNGPGAQYVAEAATAGLLAGRLARKRGYLCLQVPPYHGACLKPVMDMLDRSGLPIAQLLPSHVNQTDAYMADATLWARRGGYIDVGANYSPENNFSRATPPAKAITRLLEAGVPLSRILLSSDGNGAPPKEERREGQPAVANYMPVGALHATWRRLIVEEGLAPGDALRVVTSNVAEATGLKPKGRIAPGLDADLIAFDDDWQIRTVIARGQVMVDRGRPVVCGMFDRIILDQLA